MVDFGSSPSESAAHLAYGAKLRSYQFQNEKIKKGQRPIKKFCDCRQ